MPTGVLHLKEVDTDQITLDGALSVSGVSKLEGAIVADGTLSVGGSAKFGATETTNINVEGTLSVSGQTTIGGDIIPDTNDAYDIGSPEFKIRDMYVSDNSLWIGDTTKISNVGGSLKFRKRKTDATPQAVVNAGLTAGYASEVATTNAALSHAGVSDLSQMRLHHWHKFMLLFNPQAKLTDIFRDNDDDYEETSASDVWKEINETKIYTDTNVGIGTSDPDEALHVRGAIKVEDGFSLARNDGDNPSLIIDTTNFGLDETVNDLTGNEFHKYTKLYRVYGTNSQGVGKNWYWGYAQDDYTKFSLSFDGAGGNDPDIAFVFTTASELHCNKVFASLGGNADTATQLATPRKINGVDFDGSADINIAAGVDGITSLNGKIGVGTTNPEVPLNVVGNNALSGTPNNAIASFRATTANPGINDAGVVIGSINGNSPYIADVSTSSVGLSFYTQNAQRMHISSAGDVVIGGDSTDYDTRFQVHGGSSKFESGPYSRSQGKRYNYNFATQGNNNHTLTIPMTGSSYRGMMKLKINVIQVAANGSAANMAEIEGYISAYGGTHKINATKGVRHQLLNAEHRCANGTTSSGDLKIFYRPSAGYLQDVNVNLDIELQLGASFAHAGALSHEYASTNYAIGPHDFNTTLYHLDGYKAIERNINMTANTWVGVTNSSNDLTSGTYIMSVYINTAGYGGVLYEETYSGMLTWFSGGTNSYNVSNIDLHNAGHADNNEVIEMRTMRHGHADGVGLQLQIKSNYSWNRNLTFSFRRMI